MNFKHVDDVIAQTTVWGQAFAPEREDGITLGNSGQPAIAAAMRYTVLPQQGSTIEEQ